MNDTPFFQLKAARLFVNHDVDDVDPAAKVEPLVGCLGFEAVYNPQCLFGHFLGSELVRVVRSEVVEFAARVTASCNEGPVQPEMAPAGRRQRLLFPVKEAGDEFIEQDHLRPGLTEILLPLAEDI
jgi:hypothetical protein